jgi:hypothetical protein
MENEINREISKENPEVVEEVKDETPKLVKEAKEVAEVMKKENDRREKLIEREEKSLTRKEALNQLGGGSPAGSRPEKHEETAQEYKDRILKGGI